MGKTTSKMTTKEFAELILVSPEIVYPFSLQEIKDANDEHLWYSITSARLFDVQNVFINQLTIIGGAPFMFDLSYYNENADAGIGEEQLEDCVNEMIEGLNRFSKKHEGVFDTWYVKEDDYDILHITYERRSAF